MEQPISKQAPNHFGNDNSSEEASSTQSDEQQRVKDLELLNEGMQDIPYELLLQANKQSGKMKSKKEMGIKSKGIFTEEKRMVSVSGNIQAILILLG